MLWNLNNSHAENGAMENWVKATDLSDDRFQCDDPSVEANGLVESDLHPSLTFMKPVRNIHVTLTDIHNPKKRVVLWDGRYLSKSSDRTKELPNNAEETADPSYASSGRVRFQKLCTPLHVSHKLEMHVTADAAGDGSANVDEIEQFMVVRSGGKNGKTLSERPFQIGVAPNCKHSDDVCVPAAIWGLIKDIMHHFPNEHRDYINIFQKNPHRNWPALLNNAHNLQTEPGSRIEMMSMGIALPFAFCHRKRRIGTFL